MFLGTAAVLVFVILGLATDGEPRFACLAVVLLTVLGVQAVAELVGSVPSAPVLAVRPCWPVRPYRRAHGARHNTGHGARRDAGADAAELVDGAGRAGDRGGAGRPCLVVTGYEPEFGWYFGCDAVTCAQ
ncbi:hypothetical protein [Streptomyces enissocaesilis]|uniref:hypothetical protein n=1 Tax=Streptomyces enissocaesilis TaxID=332589 RepID=UPI0031DAFAD2